MTGELETRRDGQTIGTLSPTKRDPEGMEREEREKIYSTIVYGRNGKPGGKNHGENQP